VAADRYVTEEAEAVHRCEVLSWGSSIPVSDHWRLMDAPRGRVAKPLVSPLTPVRPKYWSFLGSLQWSETEMEALQMEDPPGGALLLFCVCSSGALLGDLLGVSRSVELDFASDRSIYHRTFLSMFTCSVSC